ncbi:unnamed protein product [Musa acuminata subsp. burmannicoides]
MAARKLIALGAIILWWCAPAAVCGDDGIVDGDVTIILPCLENLIACQENLQQPVASSACCSPMAYLFEHNSICMCSLFFNEELLHSFNVTQEQIFDLTIRCGISVAANYCSKYIDDDDVKTALSPQALATLAAPSPTNELSKAAPRKGLESVMAMILMSKMILFTFEFKI